MNCYCPVIVARGGVTCQSCASDFSSQSRFESPQTFFAMSLYMVKQVQPATLSRGSSKKSWTMVNVSQPREAFVNRHTLQIPR